MVGCSLRKMKVIPQGREVDLLHIVLSLRFAIDQTFIL